MIVGVAAVEIHIHGSQSLKAKRGVVRSISQRVRNRFNLSVSEVGGLDRWQVAVLGLAAAGSQAAVVRRVLDRAIAFIEDLHLAEVTHADIEIISLPYEEAGPGTLELDESEPEAPED
jgi:uncharacterized protein YlxP (DUF503 family)